MRPLAWTAGFIAALGLLGGTVAAQPHSLSKQTATSSRTPLAVSEADFIPNPSNALPPPPPPPPSPVAPPQPTVSAASSRPPAPPPLVVRSAQQALINSDRAAYGLGPLTWSSCLYNVAVSNAQRMAAQGFISHTNGVYSDLACGLGHQSAENVGFWSAGVNDGAINNLFMASSDHKANILGPYHYVATAWVVGANGYGYIAVEFD